MVTVVLFFVLSGIAYMLIAAVMLRSGVFGKTTAAVGMLIGVMMLVPPLPSLGMIGLVLSYLVIVPSAIWNIRLPDGSSSLRGAPLLKKRRSSVWCQGKQVGAREARGQNPFCQVLLASLGGCFAPSRRRPGVSNQEHHDKRVGLTKDEETCFIEQRTLRKKRSYS
jgi:hypothetical protein